MQSRFALSNLAPRTEEGKWGASRCADVFTAEETDLLFEARSLVRVFQIFGNIERTMILFLIATRNGVTASDIVDVIRMSRPHAYQHLKRLVAGGWIKPVRRGPAKLYVCSNLKVHSLLTNLRAIAGAQTDTFSKEHERDPARILNFRQWQDGMR